MCGRFSIAKEYEDIVSRFEAKLAAVIAKNYNAAPTQILPVVTNAEPQKIYLYRWGLVPFWSKDASIGSRMINARAETLTEKPAFRNLFKNKRCLVISDGFYEWKKTTGQKQPYRITLKDEELFAYAGLWDSWKSPEGEIINTFTIITTEANEMVRELHDRMPVILHKDDEKQWLNIETDNYLSLQNLLKPFPSEKMKIYAVSKLVNSVANNIPELIIPLEDR